MDLDAAIAEAQIRVRRAEHLRRVLDRTDAERDASAKQLSDAEAAMAAEGQDVKRLAGAHPLRIWSQLIGRLDERRMKEELEHADAVVRYDEASRRHDRILRQHSAATTALSSLDGAGAALDLAMASKAAAISGVGGAAGKRMAAAVQARADARALVQELAEAAEAADAARIQAGAVDRELQGARDWGVVDMMGGGLFVTMAKHGRLDTAQRRAADLQDRLDVLRGEIADVGHVLQEEIHIDGLASTFDYFLDGFFVDWFVQGRINQALDHVRALDAALLHLKSRLSMEHDAATEAADAADKAYERLLMAA